MTSFRAVKGRLLGVSLLVGIVLIGLGGVFGLAMASLSGSFAHPAIRPLTFPTLPEDLATSFSVSSLHAETVLLEWALQLFTDALYVAVWTGYYLGFALAAFGLLVISAGLLSTQQDRSVELLTDLISRRWFQAGVFLVLAGVIITAHPDILRIVIIGLVVLVVGGSIFGATAGSALYLYRRAESPLAVFFLYPLAIGVVLLPPAGVALVVPGLTAGFEAASLVLAVWLLDHVLVVGGLNEVVRHSFHLVGVNYFFMWVAITVAVGWLLGAATFVKRPLRGR